MSKKIKENHKRNNSKGITLVALVVTIVVLLILAGITISILFSENGIIKKVQEAKNATEQDQTNTQEGLANLADQMEIQLEEDVSSLGKLIKANTKVTKNTEVTDKMGNKVVIPKGFRVTKDGSTVQQGIVITDSENDATPGNEFVWIPVGEVTKDNGSKSNNIKLGRYTFAIASSTEPAPGTPALKQEAYIKNADGSYTNNYKKEVIINSYYKELKDKREGTVDDLNHLNDLNATAKDLGGFVESVKTNGGYYIGRYEASKNASNKVETKKGAVVWESVRQMDAALACREMYNDADENIGVKSDLVNSYAWDTAIVYIQEMGNANFANKKYSDVGSTSLANTGNNNDKFCNVYDMVANVQEWTTEYSSCPSYDSTIPCVSRGGNYNSSLGCTSGRYEEFATGSYYGDGCGSRPLCYVK